MHFEKYLNRVNYLEELIHKQGTGSPKELANKLGISERMVYRYITVLKGDKLVHFCRKRNSYIFSPLT
jgi:predicted transcriptional regulator